MATTTDRRNEIVRLINENGRVSVDTLSKQFNVSAVTIRNDLNFLEEKGLVHRAYGGALTRDAVAFDTAINEKMKLHAEEKKRIGKAAIDYIHDGDSIILDSGTTTLEIARNLRGKRDLTVLTNAINIANELASVSSINLMLTGGNLRETSFSLVGPHAEAVLKDFFFDTVFLGVDGFDIDYGLTTPNILEAQLNRIMVERSKETIVVMDSSKFEHRSLSLIVKTDQVDKVITDNKISKGIHQSLIDLNIDVILV